MIALQTTAKSPLFSARFAPVAIDQEVPAEVSVPFTAVGVIHSWPDEGLTHLIMLAATELPDGTDTVSVPDSDPVAIL